MQSCAWLQVEHDFLERILCCGMRLRTVTDMLCTYCCNTGTSRQAASAAATAALPRQLSQQQQQTYDGYTYGYAAMTVGSSGGGLSSSGYSQGLGGAAAGGFASAVSHEPGCLAMAGGLCSCCWQVGTAEAQAYSTASHVAGNTAVGSAGGGYINCLDGSLQPWQQQQQQQQLGDAGMYGVGTSGEVAGSPFAVFAGGSSTSQLAGSSTHLPSAGGAPAAAAPSAAAAAVGVKAEQGLGPQSGGSATAAAAAGVNHDTLQGDHHPSSSSMSSGSPVRPGLVASSGNLTPPPARSVGGSMDRAHSTTDLPAASSRSTVMGLEPSALNSAGCGSSSHKPGLNSGALLGPNPTGAWGAQGSGMPPPSEALGPLGLRPLGQGKLLSPAAYDMLMMGVVPSSHGMEVQYKNGGTTGADAGMGAPPMPRSSSMTSPGRQQQQHQQLQHQLSMPAPATAFGSSGGCYGPSDGSYLDTQGPAIHSMGRSYSYDVTFGPDPMGQMGTAGPIPGPGSAGGAYSQVPPPGPPGPYTMGPGSSGGAAGYDPSLRPHMQHMGRSYSTPPGYGLPPAMAPYGRSSGGGGGGCGVPGCTDPACWGYAPGSEAGPGQPGMFLPGLPLPYGPSSGLPGAYPPGPPGQPGMLASYGSAPAPGNIPMRRRSGSASGLPEGYTPAFASYGGAPPSSRGMPLNMHMNMHDQGPGMVSGMQPGLLQEAPGFPPKQQQKPRTSLGGAGHLPPLQQPPHKQQQQQPATPGFSWASVG
jgi:hypothetical protein